jgi:hypothetical protein
MRRDREVLDSFDLIITTSLMQSVDESVSVCAQEWQGEGECMTERCAECQN